MWWKLILQWRYPDSTLLLFCCLCLWAQGSWSAFAAFPQALAAISLQTAHVPPHTAPLSSPGGMRSHQSLANCACTWLPVNFSQWSYSQLFITTSYPPLPHQCRISLQCIYRCRDTEWRKIKIFCNLPHLFSEALKSNHGNSPDKSYLTHSVYRDTCWPKASKILGNIFTWL